MIKYYIAVISDSLPQFDKYVKKQGKKHTYYKFVQNVKDTWLNSLKSVKIDAFVICGRVEEIYYLQQKIDFCIELMNRPKIKAGSGKRYVRFIDENGSPISEWKPFNNVLTDVMKRNDVIKKVVKKRVLK